MGLCETVHGVPSSQSEIFEYIAPLTRMRSKILTAKEKLGHHGGRADLHAHECQNQLLQEGNPYLRILSWRMPSWRVFGFGLICDCVCSGRRRRNVCAFVFMVEVEGESALVPVTRPRRGKLHSFGPTQLHSFRLTTSYHLARLIT